MEIKKHPKLDFWCDTLGNIYNEKEILLKYKNHKRYNIINRKDEKGNVKTFSVHRLIYETWIGKIPEGLVINHIDGDRYNNSVINLEVCTTEENNQHAWKNKLLKPVKGEDHYLSILTNEKVLKIYSLIKMLYNNEEIANKLNVNFKLISLIRNGRRWKHLFNIHMKEIVPALGGNYGRDVTVPMLYESYFTSLPNISIASKFKVDSSNISNIRLGKTYKWFFKNREFIKEVYELDFIKNN